MDKESTSGGNESEKTAVPGSINVTGVNPLQDTLQDEDESADKDLQQQHSTPKSGSDEAEVAARNQQVSTTQDTSVNSGQNSLRSGPPKQQTSTTNPGQVPVEQAEAVELVQSNQPEAMETEQRQEPQQQNHTQVLNYLDGLPQEALEAYLAQRLADRFVPLEQFEEVSKRLREVDEGHISEADD
jgi:hypothetical protein